MGQVMRAEMFGQHIEVSLVSIEWELAPYWLSPGRTPPKEMRYFVRVTFIDRGRTSNLLRTDATPFYDQALHTYEENCRSQAIRLAEQALDLSPIKPRETRA